MGYVPDHKRMRRKAGPPSAEESRHHDRVRSMDCAACGAYPVSVHHVVSDGYKRLTKDHRRVIALCPQCHQYAPYAVHKIGHGQFNRRFGIDQLKLATELWEDRGG